MLPTSNVLICRDATKNDTNHINNELLQFLIEIDIDFKNIISFKVDKL